jgi:hypothetical protein
VPNLACLCRAGQVPSITVLRWWTLICNLLCLRDVNIIHDCFGYDGKRPFDRSLVALIPTDADIEDATWAYKPRECMRLQYAYQPLLYLSISPKLTSSPQNTIGSFSTNDTLHALHTRILPIGPAWWYQRFRRAPNNNKCVNRQSLVKGGSSPSIATLHLSSHIPQAPRERAMLVTPRYLEKFFVQSFGCGRLLRSSGLVEQPVRGSDVSTNFSHSRHSGQVGGAKKNGRSSSTSSTSATKELPRLEDIGREADSAADWRPIYYEGHYIYVVLVLPYNRCKLCLSVILVHTVYRPATEQISLS